MYRLAQKKWGDDGDGDQIQKKNSGAISQHRRTRPSFDRRVSIYQTSEQDKGNQTGRFLTPGALKRASAVVAQLPQALAALLRWEEFDLDRAGWNVLEV